MRFTDSVSTNVKSVISTNVTSAMLINSDGKKVRDRIDFIFCTNFYQWS